MKESVFLTENKLMNLATIGADQVPHVVPVAFMYDEGRIYVSTGARSKKVANIRRNAHVAFAVEDSTRLKSIVGKASARVLPRDSSYDSLLKKLVVHLLGSLEHPYAKLMMGPNRVIVELVPTAMKGWESPPTD